VGEAFSIRGTDFEATVDFSVAPQLRLVGSADAAALAPLEQVVDKLHAELVASAKPECSIDLVGLEFMNATCFKIFVGWLGRIQELAPERRYRIVFRSNPARAWQTRSLRTLSCFATELVGIEDG